MNATPTKPSAPPVPAEPKPVSEGWLGAQSMFQPLAPPKTAPAMSVSVGLHLALLAFLGWLVFGPKPAALTDVLDEYKLVFLQAPGPGGGGGGSPAPKTPSPVKALPPPPKPAAPTPVPTPVVPVELPRPTLNAPVVTTSALVEVGTLTGLGAAPSAGTGRGTGVGTGTGSGLGPGTGGGFGGGAYDRGSGVDDPILLKKEDPKYTPDAMRAKIQGIVELEAVVGVNGVITEVRVTKSLDRAFGLDEEAIKTAKRWLFRPGRFKGEAVAVRVTIEITFRLH